jgi:hypothetical protein
MINLFVFNLKHFTEGIVSFKKEGAYPRISLRLTFESELGIYSYIFNKDSYKDSYLEKIRILLSRIYANADQGNAFMVLDFYKDEELYLSDTNEYIFDTLSITRMSKENRTEVNCIEYKLS